MGSQAFSISGRTPDSYPEMPGADINSFRNGNISVIFYSLDNIIGMVLYGHGVDQGTSRVVVGDGVNEASVVGEGVFVGEGGDVFVGDGMGVKVRVGGGMNGVLLGVGVVLIVGVGVIVGVLVFVAVEVKVGVGLGVEEPVGVNGVRLAIVWVVKNTAVDDDVIVGVREISLFRFGASSAATSPAQ
jgi:hypothetical protein